MREHPDELRADLQEFYGLCLDGMGRDFSTIHAAALVVQLPEGSRVRSAYRPDAVWTVDRSLMAGVLNALNFIAWTKTRDGQRNRNRPVPVGPAADAARGRKAPATAMTVGELRTALAEPRKEVSHG